MNSRILLILLGFFSVLASAIPSASAFDTTGCNQVFSPRPLRYGYSYNFFDNYTNNNSYRHQVSGLPQVSYTEQYDYNASTSFPAFGWSTVLQNQGYQIPGGTTIRAVEAASIYSILGVPATRSADNFMIRYTLNYYAEQTPGQWYGPYTHVECQPYEISWCGDGVRDTLTSPAINEVCDPNDPTRAGWGNGGCDTACQPITVQPPVCDSTRTGTQTTPLTTGSCTNGTVTGFTAVGTSPINYSWACNAGGTSVACTANYTPPVVACTPGATTGARTTPVTATTPGLCPAGQAVGGFTATQNGNTTNYTWSCNGSPVGGACAASYTPQPVNGVCSTTVTGTQTAPLTTGACNTGSVINFTAVGTNPVNYSWACSGVNGGANSPACTANYTPPVVPVCGDGIRNGNEACDPNDPTQSGWGNNGCSAACVPQNITPVCSSSVTGTLPAPISNGSCNTGSPINFTAVGTSPINYSWACNAGGTSVACTANYTPPVVACTPGATTGARTTPVTATTPGLCPAGQAVGGFTATQNGNTTNYTWSCNGSPVGGNCNASYTPTDSNVCIQTFTGSLRYGNRYNFSDNFSNSGVTPLVLTNFSYQATEQGDYNLSSSFPNFEWSPWITSRAFVFPGNTYDQQVVRTVAGQTYDILAVPTVRSFSNLRLVYSFDYYFQGQTEVRNHRECINYEITWCGDGVVDNGEPCDPQAEPWRTNGTCRVNPADGSQCEIVTLACVPGTTTGARTTPVTATTPGLCPAGQAVGGFTGVTTGNTTNYTWSCNGSPVGGACAASYTPTVVSCIPGTTTGPQSAPVTATTPGLCPAGQAVGGFTATQSGSTTNYVWSCNGSPVGQACAASYTPTVVIPGSPYLTIKKYAGGQDGQTLTGAYQTTPGSAFQYTYVITNTGTAAATGVVVSDTLPQYVSLTGAIVAPAGWTCTRGSVTFTGVALDTFVCTIPLLATGSTTTIVANAILSPATPSGTQVRNVAYVCSNADVPTSDCGCPNPNDIACIPNPPPPICSPIPGNPHYDPACVTTPGGFDLVVKKYVGTLDAQTPATAVSINTNSGFNYQIVVTNVGSGSNTGTTVMQDTLPAGVEFTGATAWSNGNWNCTYTGTTRLTMCFNSVDRVGNGANVGATIFIPVIVTATAGQTVHNIASIDNPGETGRCTPTGISTGATFTCTTDVRNSDPAFITVPGGGCTVNCGGDSSRIARVCINGVATCANYANLIECIAAGNGSANCLDGGNALQLCQNTVLNCGGGGGGGGCTNPNGCGGGGFCGDGVLQVGEECDVAGAPWCNACQLTTLTNPGANPVTGIWMTIPLLSHARLGYSWIDATPGKIPFEANRMVLGLGTKAFSLADTVGFGIRTQFAVPLMIEADKRICLKSEGNSINTETLCTTFGDAAMLDPTVVTWTRPLDGKPYVILGRGDFQYQESRTGPYFVRSTVGPNNIDLFRGSRLYNTYGGGTITLNSAFYGLNIGNDAVIKIATDSMDLLALPVRVSSALVATTSTPVNRSIESFVSRTSLNAFFASILTSSSLSPTTTVRNTRTPSANLNLTINTVGNRSVKNVAELEVFALNGNKNILAVKGDLTIEYCPNNTFTMDGVRTVIVEGNLILKCNTVYGSSDTTSSWAWIVKAGNISLDPGTIPNPQSGVSKISGVYVVVGIGGVGGQFQSIGNVPSQRILHVEGSLYGYAKPLLDSRLYARGTNAYEILTTGTILTYSNRALINPPPLLSEYLGNYSVERVIR